jgi:hypothetical protein
MLLCKALKLLTSHHFACRLDDTIHVGKISDLCATIKSTAASAWYDGQHANILQFASYLSGPAHAFEISICTY